MTYDINADFPSLIVGARTGHYHWGLQEKTFENTTEPRFFYLSPATTETFAKLLDALRVSMPITPHNHSTEALLTR